MTIPDAEKYLYEPEYNEEENSKVEIMNDSGQSQSLDSTNESKMVANALQAYNIETNDSS